MKVRTLLTTTAILSSILGAVVVYLVLSVPNDLRADALLKDAKKNMTDGKHDQARASLAKIVQQYPRTDAAAAATVALVTLDAKERENLERAVVALRKEHDAQSKVITDLQRTVTEIKNAPPKIVTVTAPAKKAPVKKKSTPKKRTPTRRRR